MGQIEIKNVMPSYPSDQWDQVFAVGDLHGDVDLTVRLFRDVLKVVKGGDGSSLDGWTWKANGFNNRSDEMMNP